MKLWNLNNYFMAMMDGTVAGGGLEHKSVALPTRNGHFLRVNLVADHETSLTVIWSALMKI
jgi:hypothetical protein